MNTNRQLRILHVVGPEMGRAGIETWLMHVLRHMDRDRFCMDFLVHREQESPYGDEIASRGSKLLVCSDHSNPLRYAARFRHILREHGPYDVVHSHPHFFSGYVLRVARSAGVPKLISHSHNDTSRVQAQSSLLRKLYFAAMRREIKRHSDVGIGCSEPAAAALFGSDWRQDQRWRVLYCGVDLAPYRNRPNRVDVRGALGIPESAFVVGHVGRFSQQKNHPFLLRVFAVLAAQNPTAILLLVGDGASKPAMEALATELGIRDKVMFMGSRPDVPNLMMGAMDVFFLPSLNEGLPLVLIEAQAAGLPCVVSSNVTKEIDLDPAANIFLDLACPVSKWADAIVSRGQMRSATGGQSHISAGLDRFSIASSVKELAHVYNI